MVKQLFRGVFGPGENALEELLPLSTAEEPTPVVIQSVLLNHVHIPYRIDRIFEPKFP